MYANDIYARGSTSTPNGAVHATEPSKLKVAAGRVEQQVSHSMVSHPVVTVVAAIALGVTLGWLVKRR